MPDAATTERAAATVLSVSGVSVSYPDGQGGRRLVVDDVGFDLRRGEMLGLVGESGSGKSTTAMAVLGLIRAPGRIESGSVVLDGTDLRGLTREALRRERWRAISLVPQGAMSALNPVMRVGAHIAEALTVHGLASRSDARDRAVDLLRAVRITNPEQRVDDYPHQLSGGMRQRVMMAIALACKPPLLIADEPTTALDVTVQAQILELLREMKREFDLSLLLITHDFGVIAETADRVAVMYRGKIVEEAPVREIFRNPQHPYTKGLLASIPGGKPGTRLKGVQPFDSMDLAEPSRSGSGQGG